MSRVESKYRESISLNSLKNEKYAAKFLSEEFFRFICIFWMHSISTHFYILTDFNILPLIKIHVRTFRVMDR